MARHAFKMHLNPGCEAEYKARHDAIWPELAVLLREAGVSQYSIHFDKQSGILFACLERSDNHAMAALPAHPVMRRWWAHMKDIMACNRDGSPVAEPLEAMFWLE